MKQPSVPHRFDPHLLGPLLLVSTPAVPLADRKSFPLAPLLNNKPLTSRQSTLKTATYIRVYARHNSVLATRNPFIARSICTIYWEKKFCAKRRERERERKRRRKRGFVARRESSRCCTTLRQAVCFSLEKSSTDGKNRIDSECRSVFDTKRKNQSFWWRDIARLYGEIEKTRRNERASRLHVALPNNKEPQRSRGKRHTIDPENTVCLQ